MTSARDDLPIHDGVEPGVVGEVADDVSVHRDVPDRARTSARWQVGFPGRQGPVDGDPAELVKPEEPGLLRVADPLGLYLAMSVALGDEIVDDLDKAVHGIGWWKAYQDLDPQTRILLSDYLAACARAIPDNLVEAQVERLEHDHAAEDFRKWLSRGVTSGERSTVEPPRSSYEELAIHRVQTHLAGVLRAWGSALDCVGGCIIGVAGLPSNLVKADLDTALKFLAKESPGDQVLTQLQADLQQAEAVAGPAGWRDWLLGMRNTYVHRGRRNVTWSGNLEGNEVVDFNLRLLRI